MYRSFTRNRIWYPPAVEVIVIDLGNTNSCVAGYAPGKAETMFQFCIPSWVSFLGDGATLVGEAAKNHATLSLKPRPSLSNACLGSHEATGTRRT